MLGEVQLNVMDESAYVSAIHRCFDGCDDIDKLVMARYRMRQLLDHIFRDEILKCVGGDAHAGEKK